MSTWTWEALANLLQDIEAAHSRQEHVQNHDIVVVGTNERKPFHAVGGKVHGEVGLAQPHVQANAGGVRNPRRRESSCAPSAVPVRWRTVGSGQLTTIAGPVVVTSCRRTRNRIATVARF